METHNLSGYVTIVFMLCIHAHGYFLRERPIFFPDMEVTPKQNIREQLTHFLELEKQLLTLDHRSIVLYEKSKLVDFESSQIELASTENKGSPCKVNPCQNGGLCDHMEDPHGWGFHCNCRYPSGGRLCQYADPCASPGCPSTVNNIPIFCQIAHMDDKGRYCLLTTNFSEIPANLYP